MFFLPSVLLQNIKKFKGGRRHLKKFRKKSYKAEKRGRPFCFGIVLYLVLEALDAFTLKYCVLLVKVLTVQKMWTIQSETDKQNSHCNGRAVFLRENAPTKYSPKRYSNPCPPAFQHLAHQDLWLSTCTSGR